MLCIGAAHCNGTHHHRFADLERWRAQRKPAQISPEGQRDKEMSPLSLTFADLYHAQMPLETHADFSKLL